MARAKRTDRAEARRRHRATLDGEATYTPPETEGRAAAPGAAGRPPGIMNAFRTAFTPLDWRADLRALPMLVRHRAFYIPAILTIGATALAFATNQSLAGSESPADQDITTILGVFAFQYFVVAPPVGSAFLAGFFAPRASWLIGLLVGIIAAICLTFVVFSPLFDAVEADRAGFATSSFFVSPTGAALFAAAAAWYRRFLNLANPARAAGAGRQPARGQGRGNARQGNRR